MSVTHYFLSLSGNQRGAQAGHQTGRPDALGNRQQAELGSDVLHPAGAGEWNRHDAFARDGRHLNEKGKWLLACNMDLTLKSTRVSAEATQK